MSAEIASFIAPLEVKFVGDQAEGTFSGYGAVFGNVDAYGDVIERGAFAETLRQAKASGIHPPMLLQHGGWGMDAESLTPIGIWTGMEEDAHGLKVEGRLADTQRGREVHTLLKMQPRPALNGLSIGYRAKLFELGTKPGEPRRRLKKVDLVEVSLVTLPANGRARVTDVKAALSDPRACQELLRELGFPKSLRRRMALCVKDAAPEPDDETQLAIVRALRQSTATMKTMRKGIENVR